jgi:hypothetical protein
VTEHAVPHQAPSDQAPSDPASSEQAPSDQASECSQRLVELALEPPPPALQRLSAALDLGEFEQRLVMLAFALETDADVPQMIAQLCGGRELAGLPLSLAHLVLGSADWVASSPLAPLRRWHVLEATGPAPRSMLQVRLADNVTDAMLGLAGLDTALVPFAAPLPVHGTARTELVQDLARALATRGADMLSPVILAHWPGSRTAIAAAADLLGLKPYRLDAGRLAGAGERLPTLQRLWERDLALQPALAIVEQPVDPDAVAALAEFCSGLASHVLLLADAAPAGLRRETLRLTSSRASRSGVIAMWQTALGTVASAKLNGSVERAATHFDLAPDAIEEVAAGARAAIEGAPDHDAAERLLWAACGRAAWPEPGPLATVIQPSADWADLVVPPAIRDDLLAIVRQVRHSATVFDSWGFGMAASRGRGLLALFAGPSGTGKTLAAEVIAAQLRLPLVKADFSQLQSKWVGETPKLVGRLFDQLEAGGAVLLIDEADGLIGRRGAVVDAHDRHANVEVGYFLQRLESFRGLAILTTNLKSAIDEAFVRRFRFIVDFPVPGYVERTAIWQRVFPADAPLDGLDPDLLARLPLTGGAIRNVALNAAFLAADAGDPITQAHVVTALHAEYRKLERSPAEIDIGLLP